MVPQQRQEMIAQTVQAAPSLGAIYLWLAGITVEKWAALVGLLFLVVQTGGYLWRLRRDMRIERERRAATKAMTVVGDEP